MPRIWFPFFNTTKWIPSYTLPKTRISLGTSFQKNIGLDKQAFNTVLGYNWVPSDLIKNNVELLNVQFVRNVNIDRFFNVYQNSYEQLDDIADGYDSFLDEVQYPELEQYFETVNSSNPSLIIPEGTTGFTQAILNGDVPVSDDDLQP